MNLNSPMQGLALKQPSAGFPLLQSRLQAQPFPKTPPEGSKLLMQTPGQRCLAAASTTPGSLRKRAGAGAAELARPPSRLAPPRLSTLCALRSRAPRSAQRWETHDLAGRVEGRGGEKGRGTAWAWLAEDERAGVKGVTRGRAWCKGLDRGRGRVYKPRPWHVPLSLHPPL